MRKQILGTKNYKKYYFKFHRDDTAKDIIVKCCNKKAVEKNGKIYCNNIDSNFPCNFKTSNESLAEKIGGKILYRCLYE
ncbi:hypothetical protein COS75_03090 [Candidatus Pacearchaeota archaeon CG06_land_8_20_14_3_00_35_12]|nr:MAG: hypothetical protein COS75_03090 [Candidatus Pacearchaeota archaeon CG06_land_8_20_14_3_00_35_12]